MTLNVPVLVVVRVHPSAVMVAIVVKDPSLVILILAAVLISLNGPFYRFKIQNGDVLHHLVDMSMNRLMKIEVLFSHFFRNLINFFKDFDGLNCILDHDYSLLQHHFSIADNSDFRFRSSEMTPRVCFLECLNQGPNIAFYGLKNGIDCYCGEKLRYLLISFANIE